MLKHAMTVAYGKNAAVRKCFVYFLVFEKYNLNNLRIYSTETNFVQIMKVVCIFLFTILFSELGALITLSFKSNQLHRITTAFVFTKLKNCIYRIYVKMSL